MLSRREEDLVEKIMPSIWRIIMECANCNIESIRVDFGDTTCIWKEDKECNLEKEKNIDIEGL